MRTRGQRARMCATMRATSSTAPGRGVDVGAPQLGRQQMPAAEHVERQIAVAVVIAVEEPPLLLAVQRIVGRIEIENDLLRRALMRLQEQIDQQASIAAGLWLIL